jgi:L-fucose isomerase-like protein
MAAGPGPNANAINVNKTTGIHICPTREFSQAAFGLKMLKAGAKIREMRLIVLSGRERRDEQVQHLGTKLRYLPAESFVEEYMKTPLTSSARSYIAVRRILEREQGDGIALDCHGASSRTEVGHACIALSRLLDHGIPVACEPDIGACLSQALVMYLFDRPGFEHKPVPETARGCLIGTNCMCPTKLNGFSKPPEPFDPGRRVTVARLDIGKGPRLYVSTGTVVENLSVGGSAVSVMVKLDGQRDLLAYPNDRQLFFYGDYPKELLEYCKLFGIQGAAL